MFDTIPYISVALLIVFSLGLGFIGRKQSTGDNFFIGNRKADWFPLSFSIAAGFCYANVPFFILKWHGLAGVYGGIWVTLGIIVPLLILGVVGYYFSQNKNFSKFFNMNDFVFDKTKSKKLMWIFIFVYFLASIYAMTVNLTALGFVAEYFTTVNYMWFTGLFLLAIILYTAIGGFPAVLRTDILQLVLMLLGGLGVGLLIANNVSSPTEVIQQSISQHGRNFFDMEFITNIFLVLVIIITGSGMADNQMWQRMFTINNSKRLLKSYFMAALIYFVACFGVILVYSVATATGELGEKPIFSVIDTIKNNGSIILVTLFVIGILAASASTLDSVMHSVSSILSKQFAKLKNQRSIATAIIVVFSLIIFIITQFKIDVWVLLTTFGTVRLCIVIPTLYLIFYKNPNVLSTALAILISLAVGLYLNALGLPKLAAISITVFLPLLIIPTSNLLIGYRNAKR